MLTQSVKFCLLTLLILFEASQAVAGLMIENSAFYNVTTAGDTDSSTRIFDSLFLGSTFGKGFFIGWNMNYATRTNSLNGSKTALSGYEMGPKVGMFVNKSQTLSIAFAIHPLVKYSSTLVDQSVESWSGLAFQPEITYAPQVGKSTWFGIKIIYSSLSFSQKTTSANTTSSISTSAPSIMPSLYLSWRFN